VQPGQRIGKYVLGERIAIGGMAEVWAARVEGPRGFVKSLALKFMLESFAGDPELERLFVNEARVAAQLQHANIVSIFDFDKVGPEHGGGLQGRYYIVMERVEGRDLRQLALGTLGAGQAFPRPLALHVAGEVLKGLRYVHERREGRRPLGLIHRDVSPHNVLVSYTGEVKLSDFGIAKARAHSTSGARTGNVRGKLAYASPEQLDDRPLDHRTDQFALGVTLWELLAGRRLFEGTDELDVMTKVSRCQIPPFSSLPATRDLAPAVESVVRRMLQRQMEDRFETTTDALSAVLALPGYSGDGVPLGNLVKRLFLTQTDFPATGPLVTPSNLRAPIPDALPDTQTMLPPRKTPARDSGTRSVRPGVAIGREAPDRSSVRTSTQPTRRASPARASGGRPVTRASAAAWWRVALVAVVAALAAAGVGLWLARARQPDEQQEAPSGVPSASDPSTTTRVPPRPTLPPAPSINSAGPDPAALSPKGRIFPPPAFNVAPPAVGDPGKLVPPPVPPPVEQTAVPGARSDAGPRNTPNAAPIVE
jgi:serine/threonine-protein kinase